MVQTFPYEAKSLRIKYNNYNKNLFNLPIKVLKNDKLK